MGCRGQLGPVENVQMLVARIYLGVGRLHPLVSLHFEMYLLTSCTNSTISDTFSTTLTLMHNSPWQMHIYYSYTFLPP